MWWILLFFVCLAVLVWSSERFIHLAEQIGRSLGISSFIIGITIVAAGTSLPELVTSVIAILKDSGEIVIGNVVGSNITNIFLVIGVAAILMPGIQIDKRIIKRDFPILLATACILFILLLIGNNFSRIDSFIFIGLIILFFYYTVKSGSVELLGEVTGAEKSVKKVSFWTWVMLAFSGSLIYFSAQYMVVSIIRISEILNIGQDIIALSVVALGTSLPELAVSIAAARRKQGNMIIGNVIGSNIFNTLLVMGIPGLIHPFDIPFEMFYFSLPVMLVATLFFYLFSSNQKLSKFNGIFLVTCYVLYLGVLFFN